ncbi:hypothetical protein TNCV_2992411 [Trichonephila clavipes]|nr:hypothetical protein TNCV_2992411 [Trichonephila clavipes]
MLRSFSSGYRRISMSEGKRLQMVWLMRAAITIPHMMAALLFQRLLPGSKKISVPHGGRLRCMCIMKETVLVLLCLGQAVNEMKLLLLGFVEGVLELNGMWWILKFTILVRIIM